MNVLPILLGALTLIFSAILWLGSVFMQGWLYNDLAKRLPLRALVGGIILALFHTGWCAVYKADPGRFDTLPNFSSRTADGSYDEIESVRRVGTEEKKPVRFHKFGDSFVSVDGSKGWRKNDAEGIVVALLIKEKDKNELTRFDAVLDAKGNWPADGLIKFEADKGRRYIQVVAPDKKLGEVTRVRSMAVIGNLFANLLHLIVWVAVLWPIMRFSFGHAVAIAFGLWAITMLAVQPALFGLVVK